MKSLPLLVIDISKTRSLTFYERFLIYGAASISYKEIQGLSYLLTRTKYSLNSIPTGTQSSFEIRFDVNGQLYKIASSASSSLFRGQKSREEKEEIFAKLVHVMDNLIKPFVVVNVLIRYAKENKLKIDWLTITPKGLYRKRLLRQPELLLWEQYHSSVLHQGVLYVLKQDAAKEYKTFFSCPMSAMNAVILPDVLTFLFQRHGTLDQATIKYLENKRASLL